jgi:hypothetical protein
MMPPKPRPINPRSLKRLPEEGKRMTIALGILGHNCLIVGADTQETYGDQKYEQGKIASSQRSDPYPRGAICVSGAGDGPHIDAISEQIIEYFQNFSGTMDEFEVWLRKFVSDFYRAHVMPFVGKVDSPPGYRLIIAVRHDRKFRLWTTSKTVVSKVMPYAVVGISAGSSSALLNQLYKAFPSVNNAAMLAAYVIRQAKLSADGVGLDTEIRFIYGDYVGIVSADKIQGWEYVFAKYQWVLKEMFSHICGYRELDILLPGSPVKHTLEFKHLARVLRGMRKELSKLPVIPGLDEPSKRSTSEMSELGQ